MFLLRESAISGGDTTEFKGVVARPPHHACQHELPSNGLMSAPANCGHPSVLGYVREGPIATFRDLGCVRGLLDEQQTC